MTKQLMFCISNNLTKDEAIEFASKLSKNEQYFLVKVFENPKEIHRAKREKYVVLRHPRENEKIVGAYKKEVTKKELIAV